MLLAIDTSAGTSVALVDAAGVVLAERNASDTMRHAELVGQSIAECLTAAGATGADITGVVAGMGPGPFTGLRVGIAAARVFALAIERPLLPLVSHDAVALERYEAGHTGELLIVTDARRREVYYSRYSGTDALGLPVRLGDPGLSKPIELEHEPASIRFDASEIPAAALARLAFRRLAAGHPFEADEALYLRSPDVTPPTGIKRVTR